MKSKAILRPHLRSLQSSCICFEKDATSSKANIKSLINKKINFDQKIIPIIGDDRVFSSLFSSFFMAPEDANVFHGNRRCQPEEPTCYAVLGRIR